MTASQKQRRGLIHWLAVQLLRAAGLNQPALTHHSQLVGKGQGLRLIVRHQNGGDAGLAQQLGHHLAHGGAQAGIQCRERLIQQHQLRLLRQARARAMRCCWPPDSSCGQRDSMAASSATISTSSAMRRVRSSLECQAKADIVGHRQGKQCAILRHITNATQVRGQGAAVGGKRLAVQADAALVGIFEAGNHAQQGCFARAGGPTMARRLPAGRQRNIVDRAGGAKVFAQLQVQGCHRPALRFEW
jgi:hypothetical protein